MCPICGSKHVEFWELKYIPYIVSRYVLYLCNKIKSNTCYIYVDICYSNGTICFINVNLCNI